MRWGAWICKASGTHELFMSSYPPGPVLAECERCGYVEIRPAVPEPVHGSIVRDEFRCGICRRWCSFPPGLTGPEAMTDHFDRVHPVKAEAPPVS